MATAEDVSSLCVRSEVENTALFKKCMTVYTRLNGDIEGFTNSMDSYGNPFITLNTHTPLNSLLYLVEGEDQMHYFDIAIASNCC